MSRTESTMVQLGTIAPPFELVDVLSGRAMGRDDVFALSWDDDLADKDNIATSGGPTKKHGLLVMFVCAHCPYVKHLEREIANIARDYFGERGEGPIAMCAIMSNDVAQFPDDGPEGMREQAERLGWRFPYLLDEEQEVARAYGAACTPDFFLFNAAMELVYRGQMDDSRPRRSDGFGNDVLNDTCARRWMRWWRASGPTRTRSRRSAAISSGKASPAEDSARDGGHAPLS